MKKRWKKVLSSLLALSLVVGAFPLGSVTAQAEVTQKVNYALGAAASANDVEVSYWGADKTVDGIVNREAAKAEQSRWSTNTGSDAKVLDVDLGEVRTFDEFKIEWERTNIKGFTISVSSDGENYETAYAKTDDSYVQLTSVIKLDEAVSGQYVKLSVDNYDGGDINWPSVSIYEFEVIGTVVLENLALSATATASDIEDAAFAASKANDGIANTDEETNLNQSRWASAAEIEQKWLQLDFGEAKTVASVVLVWERCNASDYKIQYSNDGSEWADAAVFTAKPALFEQVINFEEAVEAQYLRLLINDFDSQGVTAAGTSVDWPTVSVYEFEAYSVEIEEGGNETVDSVLATLEIPEIEAGATNWSFPEIPDGFDIEFVGADYEQVIGRDFTIYQPLVDTTVEVTYIVSKDDVSKESSAYEVVVPGKYEVEEGDNAKPVVIPELAEWKGHTGDFAITDTTKLVVNPEYQEELTYTAESFAADYEDVTGNAIEIEYSTAPATGDFYFTLGSEDAGLGEEGYIMTIADYVTVEAVDKTGAFWAVQTVMQILKQTDGTMPKGITRDYPKFEVRGFMLDVGRKPFEMDYLYETAKTMAYYKLNDFGIHLNDNYIWVEEYNNLEGDQWAAYSAFRLESDIKAGGNDGKNQADLTATDLYYEKDEFRTFIQDAREMGIDVVPEFDAPAHSLAFTKVRPDLALPEDSTNRWADHFDLSNPESEEFMKSVWNEYMTGDNPVFDQDTILNIGTDEYEGSSDDFRTFSANMINFVQDSGRTVRLWGSLTMKNSDVEVPSEDVQMLIWNTGWANPASMYAQGYDLINIQDGYVYMVPSGNENRGGYGDRLNLQSVYNNWTPNTIGGTTISAGSEQMLGGAFAIWNDNIDRRANGLSEYDNFDRFFEAAPYIAEKSWNDGDNQDYATFAASIEGIGTAPNTNPYFEVESKKDDVAEYNFDDESVKDSTRNKYNGAEGENTAYVEGKEGKALQLNGGSSYVTTPIEAIGPTVEVSFWVKAAAGAEGEQILFDDGHTQVKMAQAETGKVGFSREFYDYSFEYELPADEWVYLTFKTAVKSTELYVNGELVDTVSASMTGGKHATLVFPLAKIGSEENAFTGLIDELTVTKAEVVVIDDSATRIPTDGFTVTCDNEYGGTTTEGVIALAFDGNESTIWHSNYSPYEALPATIEINMGQPYVIDQFDYLPRQDGSRNGRILTYELYGKLAETDEYTLITDGSWGSTMDLKRVYFDPAEYQYLKFVAVTGDTDSGNMFASAAEFYIHEYDEKGDLKAVYAEAESYTEEDAADYTEESWNALVEAKEAALAVIEKEDATAEEIAEATAALQAALEGLTEVGETPVEPENPFIDVYEDQYYYDAILWAHGEGIAAGMTENTFVPDADCTRSDVVTFLWRAFGSPEATGENPFTDVAADDYYYDAVVWAYENGIAAGTTATTFEPAAECTRGQVVTFLWRASGEPAATVENPFVDVGTDTYYYDAILWAYENGIAAGVSADNFEPGATCTRGQAVTFIYRVNGN